MTAFRRFATTALLLCFCGLAGAVAAQAEGFDVGASPAIITGAQVTSVKTVFGESGVSATCTTATLSGTTESSSVNEINFTPSYGSSNTCKLGGLTATIDLMGCTYRLTWGFFFPWTRHIECKPGQGPPTIFNVSCKITLPAQTLSGIKASNSGSGSTADVLLTFEETGMSYTGGSGCPANVVGSHTDGKVTGTTTIKAFKDEAGSEGAQVSLSST